MRTPAAIGRAVLCGALMVLPVALGGCGGSDAAHASAAPSGSEALSSQLRPHPKLVEPAAGGGQSAGVTTESIDLPQPVSDAEIRRELNASHVSPGARGLMTPDGLAVAPLDAPAVVQEVISAGNQIAKLPYRFGGGHGTFEDTAYDCSGSISFVFAAAGLLNSTVDSTALESYGLPGPGRWITIFANAGHTFMYVAGLRFDTGGLRVSGSRWQPNGRDTSGFVVRHPPGL
jgi:hypothetical protein